MASDDNNGTLWRAGNTNMGEWWQVDLGSLQTVKRVMTYFEFATFYYQYKIEYSADGSTWSLYANKTANKKAAAPYLDDLSVSARHIRITVTGTEKPGHFAAIWNVKVYNEVSPLFTTMTNQEATEGPYAIARGNKLIDLDIANLSVGNLTTNVSNLGTLGGNFSRTNTTIAVGTVSGKKALTFGGSSYMRFSQNAPNSLAWNSPYTLLAWVYNPTIEESETIIAWARRGGPNHTYAALYYGTNSAYGAVGHWAYADMPFAGSPLTAGMWHHLAVCFDGLVEKLYVDGKLNRQMQKNLYVNANSPIYIAWSSQTGGNTEFLTGSIASLKAYDYALNVTEVTSSMNGGEILTAAENEEVIQTTSLSLYPNPCKTELHISSNDEVEKIEMWSTKGTKQKEVLVYSKTADASTADLPPGLYVVKLFGKSVTIVRKLLVE